LRLLHSRRAICASLCSLETRPHASWARSLRLLAQLWCARLNRLNRTKSFCAPGAARRCLLAIKTTQSPFGDSGHVWGIFGENTGNIRGAFGEHSGNFQTNVHSGSIWGAFRYGIHRTFRVYSGTIVSLYIWGTFGEHSEHSGNIQGKLRFINHSGNIWGAFMEHSGNVWGTFGKHSGTIPRTFMFVWIRGTFVDEH
jgi:hypothetical protein